MPIIYVCRKCERSHSKEEYLQSRFCRTCGSFLLQTFIKEEQRLATRVAINETTNGSTKEKFALFRAAESLRQRIGRSKEYEIVSEAEKEQPKAPAFESWIWGSEYDEP